MIFITPTISSCVCRFCFRVFGYFELFLPKKKKNLFGPFEKALLGPAPSNVLLRIPLGSMDHRSLITPGPDGQGWIWNFFYRGRGRIGTYLYFIVIKLNKNLSRKSTQTTKKSKGVGAIISPGLSTPGLSIPGLSTPGLFIPGSG